MHEDHPPPQSRLVLELSPNRLSLVATRHALLWLVVLLLAAFGMINGGRIDRLIQVYQSLAARTAVEQPSRP